MGAKQGVHCPHTAHDTLSSLLTTPPHTLYENTLGLLRGCERDRHLQPPQHHLYKTPWAFTELVREGGLIAGANQGVHCPHTAHDTRSSFLTHTPF